MTISSQLIVRPLTAEDTAAYRDLRQKVLRLGDGKYFSDSYTREASLSDEEWRLWCTEKAHHCIFGTFDQNTLIGVMMVTQHGQPEDKQVEWEAIWLEPAYRGKGIASLAYRKVHEWSLQQGYSKVALYIRDDNQHSINIHEKMGARYVSTKRAETWADGSVADVHAFKLSLYENGLRHVAEQHAGLTGEVADRPTRSAGGRTQIPVAIS